MLKTVLFSSWIPMYLGKVQRAVIPVGEKCTGPKTETH